MSRWLQLPCDLKIVYVRAALLLAVTEVALRLIGLRRTARLLGVRLASEVPVALAGDPDVDVLDPREQQLVRVVLVLTRRTYGTERGCLRKAIVLARFLRGHHPVVQIGAKREDEQLLMHAWVDVGGAVIDAGQGFVPFVSSEEPGR